MPPVRTSRSSKKPPPDGFEDLEDTLLEFQNKMKDAENASHEGKKKYEMVWPVFQITHQRSRYIYELYYEKEAISKTLYDWLLKNGYADAMLIAKWKKQGYEKVCISHEGAQVFDRRARRLLFNVHGPNFCVALLPAMHPDQGDEFPIDVHLSRAQGTVERRSGYTVRQLWMSWLLIRRLSDRYWDMEYRVSKGTGL